MSIGERHLFSWLHLSDLHFGHGNRAYGWDQKRVLRLLEKDVQRALREWPELPRPDAILVTGDIAFSGAKRSEREYADATAFFERLTSALGIEKSRLFLVPGNHDVQRDVAKDLVERARADPSELENILANDQERSLLFSRQANYRTFADAFSAQNLAGWVEEIQIPNFGPLKLVGLNTALLSNDDQDRGKLVLAGEQRELIGDGDGTALLLTHHPLSDGWLDDEAGLNNLVQNHVKVHLCGHVHDPRVNLVAEAGAERHVTVVAAAAHRDPAESKAGKDSHGYNFASLVIDARGALQVRTWPRRWFPKWQAFRVDHLGVPDRGFYDNKPLDGEHPASGLVLHGPNEMRISGVHFWGKPVVRWDELLHGRARLEVFGIALKEVFDDVNREHVKDLLDRGGSVQVVLADPRDKLAMARYDEDFGKPLGDRSKKVLDALRSLKSLRASLKNPSRLTIALTRHSFKYSAYRLDGDVLFVPYRITAGKDSLHTAALVFDRQSPVVTSFIGKDLDALRDSASVLDETRLNEVLEAGL